MQEKGIINASQLHSTTLPKYCCLTKQIEILIRSRAISSENSIQLWVACDVT